MSVSLMRDTNTITVANFWENYLLKKYNFSPAYQRGSVWSDEKQSFLIDSLLKNFPIPPIFLHQKIDDDTGTTRYDVIDGKQRLTSIIRFLENEIPVFDESEENPFHDEKISGVYFKDLDKKELAEYKKKLWRYVIPIEYVDTAEKAVIDNIFDRLNRNGEKLEGQELRRSKYHGTDLLTLVEKLADENAFWKKRLEVTDVSRMEHYEFVSEIIFQQIEGEPLKASQDILDKMYEKYTRNGQSGKPDWKEVEGRFLQTTSVMESMGIDYDGLSVGGVSHLYGIWCLASHCEKKGINPDDFREKLTEFYTKLRSRNYERGHIEVYSKSMSSRTKDKGQRKHRFEALLGYLELS